MAREEIRITTDDGECRTSVFTPSAGDGPWPGVLFCMDGLGYRPTLFDMSQRIADAGYVVLLPDFFHRAGKYEPLDVAELFASGNMREKVAPLMGSTDNVRGAKDAGVFLDRLFERNDVSGTKVGTTGYCMGGGISFSIAGTHPDRVAAAASFHGGRLATDDPASPHLLADKITARVYVGAADNDGSYPPDMASRLIDAFMTAHVDHRHDLYVGAAHGWTMADFPVYDAAAADRHFDELLDLFAGALQ